MRWNMLNANFPMAQRNSIHVYANQAYYSKGFGMTKEKSSAGRKEGEYHFLGVPSFFVC